MAMDIREGDVFVNSPDGLYFIVKKVANEIVVLESQDGKAQILTGVRTFPSYYLKKAEGE